MAEYAGNRLDMQNIQHGFEHGLPPDKHEQVSTQF